MPVNENLYCKRGIFFVLIAIVSAVLAACAPATQNGETTSADNTAAVDVENAANQTDVSNDAVLFCPFCRSEAVEKQPSAYTHSILGEKQTCPYDQFQYETGLVLATSACTCSQCGKTWVQEERYILSSCPAHGELLCQHESVVQ